MLELNNVSNVVAEIDRIMKLGGKPILTTPNIASLFGSLRLLIGMQPQYVIHVREYTKKEVEDLLKRYGLRILRSQYSEINGSTHMDAEPEEYLNSP